MDESTALFDPSTSPFEIKFQEPTIRKISLDHVIRLVDERPDEEQDSPHSISSLLDRIVKIYGETHRESFKLISMPQEVRRNTLQATDRTYTFQGYYRDCCNPPPHLKFIKAFGNNISLSSAHLEIIFFLHCSTHEIYAITTGNAFAIVSHCIDNEFAFKVARKILDPRDVTSTHVRYLSGQAIEKKESYKPRRMDLSANVLTRMYQRLCSSFKPDADIYQMPPFKELTADPENRIRMEFTNQLLKIKENLSISELCSILEYFENIILTKKDDKDFDFLNYVIPVGQQKYHELDRLLLQDLGCLFEEAYSHTLLYISHRYTDDFNRANTYTLYFKEKTLVTWRSIPSMQQIMEGLSRSLNKDNFAERIIDVKIGFHKRGKHFQEPLTKFIEGQILDREGTQFFRLGAVWYEVSAEYLLIITRKFREVLKHSLMSQVEAEELLPQAWPSNLDENAYSSLYFSSNSYLIADRCETIRGGIEMFDILKFDSKALSFIQVKPGFGQKTRDACSQVINAATIYDGARKNPHKLHNLIEDLWEAATREEVDNKKSKKNEKADVSYKKRVKEQFLSLSTSHDEVEAKKKFLELFQSRREPIFVYAFRGTVPDIKKSKKSQEVKKPHKLQPSQTRMLHQDLRPVSVTSKDFEDILLKNRAEKFIKLLQENNYIDDEGWPTDKLYMDIPSKKGSCLRFKFPFAISKEENQKIRQKLFNICVSQYNTLIAMLDITRTYEKMLELEIPFKICQISELKVDDSPSQDLSREVSFIGSQLPTPSHLEFSYPPYTMIRYSTRGNGSCALHALLGKLTGDMIAYQPDHFDHKDPDIAVKDKYLKALKEKLSVEVGNGDISNKYRELMAYFLNSYNPLEEFKESSKNVCHFFETSSTEIKRLSKQYKQQLSEFFSNKKALESQIIGRLDAIRKDQSHVLYDESLFRDNENLDTTTIYNEQKDNFNKILSSDPIGNSILNELKDLSEKYTVDRNTLLTHEALLEHYTQIFLKKEYWLLTDELIIAGLLFDKSIILFRHGQQDPENYSVSDTNPVVYIRLNDSEHFEQCRIKEGDPSTVPLPTVGVRSPSSQSTLFRYFSSG